MNGCNANTGFSEEALNYHQKEFSETIKGSTARHRKWASIRAITVSLYSYLIFLSSPQAQSDHYSLPGEGLSISNPSIKPQISPWEGEVPSVP